MDGAVTKRQSTATAKSAQQHKRCEFKSSPNPGCFEINNIYKRGSITSPKETIGEKKRP